MSKIHVTTSSGFECDVNPKITKDYRFIKLLRKLMGDDQEEQFKSLVDVISFLLGEDGEERITQHVMDEDGIADIELINKEVTEILASLQNNPGIKN